MLTEKAMFGFMKRTAAKAGDTGCSQETWEDTPVNMIVVADCCWLVPARRNRSPPHAAMIMKTGVRQSPHVASTLFIIRSVPVSVAQRRLCFFCAESALSSRSPKGHRNALGSSPMTVTQTDDHHPIK